jgi:putative flippase GtrA
MIEAAAATPTIRHRIREHGPQFFRYLCVGVCNTIFGYGLFVTFLTLLNAITPPRYLFLTVVLASVLSTPFSITFAYFGYKFFVFRTAGNYLREWLKCFAVYGTTMIPGLVILSALTKTLQALFHRHSPALHAALAQTEAHLSGHPLALLHRIATGSAMAGYVAGACVTGFSTIFSFIGHKRVTFHRPPA